MVRCRCGVWTDYGLSCFNCRMEIDRVPVEPSEDEDEIEIVEVEDDEEEED